MFGQAVFIAEVELLIEWKMMKWRSLVEWNIDSILHRRGVNRFDVEHLCFNRRKVKRIQGVVIETCPLQSDI